MSHDAVFWATSGIGGVGLGLGVVALLFENYFATVAWLVVVTTATLWMWA